VDCSTNSILASTVSGFHNEDETMLTGKYQYQEKCLKAAIDDTITACYSSPWMKTDVPACALSLELTSDEVSEMLFTVGSYDTGINKPTDLKLSLTTLNKLTSRYLILYCCDESKKWPPAETNDEWYNTKKKFPQIDYFSEYYHNRR
jgi:hypothetical protein